MIQKLKCKVRGCRFVHVLTERETSFTTVIRQCPSCERERVSRWPNTKQWYSGPTAIKTTKLEIVS